MKRGYLFLFIIIISNALSASAVFPENNSTYPLVYSVKKAEDLADQKQREAQQTATLINSYYNKGRACYQSQRYKEAVGYFEKILEIDPSYEPAKLYLEGAIIRQRVSEIEQEVEQIKLKMADIIAEYDKRRERMDGLAIKYFLEQAQRMCQLGDYQEAEKFYSLCYKIYPYNKDKLEWFVRATYDLIKLSHSLEEQSRKIDELAASMSDSTF